MTIEFRKTMQYCNVLNPLKEFKEDIITIETRFDPLTGDRCDFPLRPATPQKIDQLPIVNKSIELGCPFCIPNVYKVTPKFPPALFPEGRVNRGQAWLVPNLAPWTEHNPIIVVSEQHYVPFRDFNSRMLADAFMLSQDYFNRVGEMGNGPRYKSVIWNYMPPAGGSQIHPHLQMIGQSMPSPIESKIFSASAAYKKQNSSIFWQDLIEEEKRLGERYLGDTGQATWLVNYVSRNWLFEIVAIFRERYTISDLSEEDWISFGDGLEKVFQYMDDKGLYSFNLSFYSGTDETTDHFYTYVRIIPRSLFSPVLAADVAAGRLLHDWCFGFLKPEDVCAEAKPYFDR